MLLICQPSREAERRFCGVGRPAWMPGEPRWAMDGPWRRAHGAGPEGGNLSAAKAVRQGQGLFGSFCGCLTKGTRRKGETNIPVICKCRICTRINCFPVVADERSEAAIELVRHCDAALVKPDTALVQVNPGLRFYGRFATGRSLAPLVSGYKV